jgi:hypothetical protein
MLQSTEFLVFVYETLFKVNITSEWITSASFYCHSRYGFVKKSTWHIIVIDRSIVSLSTVMYNKQEDFRQWYMLFDRLCLWTAEKKDCTARVHMTRVLKCCSISIIIIIILLCWRESTSDHAWCHHPLD